MTNPMRESGLHSTIRRCGRGIFTSTGDGSVRTLKGGIAYDTFWALVTPAGGEVPGDW